MPDFAVSTAFTAQDRVTKAFGSMGRGADKFGKKSTKAFRQASRAGGGLLSKLGSLRTMVAGVGTVLATGFAARAVNRIASIGDEAAKTGRQIGITAEALQELRFAADRQGVTSEVLTKSLQLLNRNIGDLKAGQGTLTTMLNRTNPALAKQLKNVKTNEEAFGIFIKEINKLPTQMEKAALAQAAFGRGGQDILKLAEAGTIGIKALREEARKYGGIVSNEAAAGSEKYVDALTNLKATLKGVTITLVTGVVPALTKTIQSFADFLVKNRAIIALRFQQSIDLMKQAFVKIKPVIKAVFKIISALLPVIEAFLPIMPVLVGGWIAYGVALKAVAIAQAIAGFIKFIGVLRGMVGSMGLLNVVMAANPLGIVILAITALIAAGVLLVKNWDVVKAAVIKAYTAIADSPFSFLIAPIQAVIAAGNLLIKNWDVIKAAFKKTFDFVMKGIRAISKFTGLDLFSRSKDSVIGFDVPGDETEDANRQAPNAADVESRQNIAFKGQLNIAGAPPGSTVESETTGAPPIDVDLLGANA